MRIVVGVCLLSVVCMLAAGCGPGGPQRYDISGKVTYGGRPVPAGSVSFMPDTSKGNSGPGHNASIKEGQYRSAPGKGVVGGPHKIRIYGFDGKPVPQLPLGRPLFPPYTTEVDLPTDKSTYDFDIPK